MSHNNLFAIKDLLCSYSPNINSSKDILTIDNLVIKKGQLVFVIGKSGSGKSTFIETLGLMSNTIKKGSIHFYSGKDSQIVSFSELWKETKKKSLENIRKKNFSFIFQKTKFPDGYSVISSVSFSQLLQNVTEKDARNVINEYLTSIGLSLNDTTMPYELSGGMAQQAAFIRALSRHFTILFGDEPTGNIDNALSFQLLSLLKKSLSARNASAIIVTHHIPLALEFADQIILITKNGEECGIIAEDSVFHQCSVSDSTRQWVTTNKKSYSDDSLHAYIESHIKSSRNLQELKDIPFVKEQVTSQNNTKHLERIFIQKEYSKLSGQKKNTKMWGWRTWLLFTNLWLTFLTIGFAVGSCQYLKEKISDPYMNFVDISVPWERSDDITIDSIFTTLGNDSIIAAYFIQNVNGHKVFSLSFQNNSINDAYEEYVGRTVGLNNSLLQEIVSEDNLITGKPFDTMDIGLIVTRELLEYLNYIDPTIADRDIHVPFIQMLVKEDIQNHIYRYIPIPIKAIVKELPGLSKFISSPYFYVQRFGSTVVTNPFTSYDTKRLHLWTENNDLKFDSLMANLKKFTKVNFKTQDPMISFEEHSESYINGYTIVLSLYPEVTDIATWDSIFQEIKTFLVQRGFSIHRQYHFQNLTSHINLDKYDQLSVYFQKLDKVRNFEKFFNNEFKMEIDIAKIKEKENYNFVSKLTFILGMVMVLMSAGGICVFISTIIFNHLREESENIGIHKAFGMTYSFLISSYMKVTLRFLGQPLLFSLFLSYVGSTLFVKVIIYSTNFLERNKTYFDIFNMWTGISILFIVISVVISVFITMNKILKSTPSDLIYSRN